MLNGVKHLGSELIIGKVRFFALLRFAQNDRERRFAVILCLKSVEVHVVDIASVYDQAIAQNERFLA